MTELLEKAKRALKREQEAYPCERAIGDSRPFVYVAAPDGTTPLLVIRADEIEAVVDAFIAEWAG